MEKHARRSRPRAASYIPALLLCLAGSAQAGADAAPPEGWRVLPAEQARLSRSLRTPVLAEGGRTAQAAYFEVRAPYAQVRAGVEDALRPLGRFDGQHWRSEQAYLREGWDPVLMSRRPDLRREYARLTALPALAAQVEDGWRLPWELERDLARAEASHESVPQRRIELEALRRPYRMWEARHARRFGLSGRHRREDVVAVIEMDALFGEPTTIVSVHSELRWPNPDGGIVDQIRGFDLLSGGPPRHLQARRVPADLFGPVRAALEALPQARTVAVHDAPAAWVLPAAPLRAVREPIPAPAAESAPVPATVLWTLGDARGDLHDLLSLADGSLLLAGDDGQRPVLWRYRPGAAADVVWRGQAAGVDRASVRLMRDPDGARVYVVMADAVAVHHLGSGATTRHPVELPQDVRPHALRHWRQGPDGRPELFLHVYPRSAPSGGALQRLAGGPVPAADGAPWRFSPVFRSGRQAIAAGYLRGNGLMRPLDAIDDAGVWAEEPTGLALLDPAEGRVLRAIELPLRLGEADGGDDTGMAEHVPAPFGSRAGGWAATGFRDRDGSGMHVTDLGSGATRLSPWLAGVSPLRAAGASPDGARIALGGALDRGRGTRVGIWRIATGEASLAAATPRECTDLQQLVWSADGDRLWGLCRRQLLVWTVQ